jgi:flagellar basal-body rod protein FlgG
MRSLDIAGTGMQAQQTNVEVISNNIANMTTTGFKGRRAEFQDLIYQNLRRVGSDSSDTGTVIAVRRAGRARCENRGDPTASMRRAICRPPTRWTWRSRATATSGDAAIRRHRLYARRTFGLAADGTIVTADGYIVQPGLQIPSNATGVTVNASGQVQVTLQGQTAPQTVGQLQLAVFPNEAGLDAQGDNLFLQTAASGQPVTGNPASPGFGSVMQGFIETSNVNVVTEITNLITAQRAYEMNSRVITTNDEMLSTLTNLR